MNWLAAVNRVLAVGLMLLGFVVAAVGLYLALFAWLNDGATAGFQLALTTCGFGVAFILTGWYCRIIARAHVARSPRRWWLQTLLPIVGWILFGLAAELSSLGDRLNRN